MSPVHSTNLTIPTDMNSELADLIRVLEMELLRPDTRQSRHRLDELIANDFVEFGESGNRYTKHDLLRMLPALGANSYTMHDFEARAVAPDIVLATYRIESKVAATGHKTRSMRSSLWQHHNDRWQIVFHQGTPENS
jgi:hypothetical protein